MVRSKQQITATWRKWQTWYNHKLISQKKIKKKTKKTLYFREDIQYWSSCFTQRVKSRTKSEVILNVPEVKPVHPNGQLSCKEKTKEKNSTNFIFNAYRCCRDKQSGTEEKRRRRAEAYREDERRTSVKAARNSVSKTYGSKGCSSDCWGFPAQQLKTP